MVRRRSTYDNAKLSHALILSGRAMGQTPVLERGLQTLRWLVKMQTSEHGHFRPIGSNGFYPRGGTRADFDQQPIEAQAMVSACLEAYRSTSDSWWYEQAQRAFDWFLGWNDLGLELYSPNTGGCRDGLHVDRVNRNQGAESTLAFLLSLAEMRLMHFEVQFDADASLSERVLFPFTAVNCNGIEDARFVLFENDDGTPTYYATPAYGWKGYSP